MVENGGEERNGKDAALGRRLEKLRRDFGPTFLAALNDPQTIEILLNADGTLWQEKIGRQMEIIGQMSAARAEAVLRTIAACLNTVITWDQPTLEGEFPLDGSRFAGQLPPVVSAPTFAIRRRASSVFTLDQYVEQGIMTPEQKQTLCSAIREHKNILVIGGTGGGKAQPDEALVLTPQGFRRMADLNVGNLVTCPDGSHVPVTGVFPQGEKEIYRIDFEDGRSAQCCDDHLWRVWSRTSTYVKGTGA